MFGFLARWDIRSAEKRLGVPLDALRQMHEKAPGAFAEFTKFGKLADFRDKLPPAPFHVARLVAAIHDDCGTCVQRVVNEAKADGVEAETLRLALAGEVDALPEQLRDVYRFAEAVVARTGEEAEFRDRLRRVFGDEAVVELGLAVATARVLPTLNRALGFATKCASAGVEV
ncbi:MAG: carboxymuconolactone decarboxylase family protein [Gemmataceae bacterium]|nr:carboxymuconolactone decarboxylase family protein [Gemmataceae bacterium]